MKRSVFFGLGSALFSVGLALCGFLVGERVSMDKAPSSIPVPVFATASSESDGVVISTGVYGGNVEAMYYLDSQSCRLSAALVSRSTPEFQKSFTRNLKTDLAEAAEQLHVSVPSAPKFLMVTGEADVRNVGAVANMSRALVYVAEINTGIVFVYALPGTNDRDLPVSSGEIFLWTFARLNDGLQASSFGVPQPTESKAGSDPQLIDSGFFRNR